MSRFSFKHFQYLKDCPLQQKIQCHWTRTTTSTNDNLKEYIRKNLLNSPYALLARHQTSGRGTKGKSWSSQHEALMFSVAYPLSTQKYLSMIPLIVGFSILKTLAKLNIPLQLKWPNDLLLNQGKLGGILCEVIRNYCVIGVGINLEQPTLPYTTQGWPVSSLQNIGRHIALDSPECAALWHDILEDLLFYLEYFSHLNTISHFVSQWNQCDYLYQKDITFTVSTSSTVHIGKSLGINHRGRYQIFTSQGVESFHDISILPF